MDKAKLLIFGALLAGGCGISTMPHCSRDQYQVKVSGTERVVDSDSGGKASSKYIVFTADAKTGEERAFENTDSFLEWKFDSSTLQARLKKAEKEGTACDLKTYGWRIPFFSSYENIVYVNCK